MSFAERDEQDAEYQSADDPVEQHALLVLQRNPKVRAHLHDGRYAFLLKRIMTGALHNIDERSGGGDGRLRRSIVAADLGNCTKAMR